MQHPTVCDQSHTAKKWTEILVAQRKGHTKIVIFCLCIAQVSVKSVPISGYYEITNFLCTVSPN